MLVISLILGLALWGNMFTGAGPYQEKLQEYGRESDERRTADRERLARSLAAWVRHSFPAERYEAELLKEGGAGERLERTWRESLGELLMTWMETQNPSVRFRAEKGEATEKTKDPDPSYERYMAEQSMREEAAYLALFGDENSMLQEYAAENGAGNGSRMENGGNKAAEGREGRTDMGSESGGTKGAAGGLSADTAGSAAGLSHLTPAYDTGWFPVTGTEYMMEQLMDYDFLMKHFYSVHSSTTARREEMDAKTLLDMDLSIEKEGEGPQILIYHTHSQETYADYGPDNPEATVVGIGNYLTELLEQKGYRVLHDTTVYDLINGELDRNHAYNYALEGITEKLQKHPTIQVILDVHRDGVREGLHLVSQVNGKAMAPIMFFNGMSQTPEGPIEYLQNPYKEENLAFSLQMQLDAAAYFPGFTRKIYLKGLRYNLHLRPRSALIEVGAQTNTYAEARNAMEPLAELLHMVLTGP